MHVKIIAVRTSWATSNRLRLWGTRIQIACKFNKDNYVPSWTDM